MKLESGQMLGRYRILSLLGEGGMGVVYRARDSRLERDVAVKVVTEQAAGDPQRVERFIREARAVARLSHPNILDIHDFGTHEGTSYAVTEVLQGRTLQERLATGHIPVDKGLSICRAIAEGLAAAHGEGIIHRDIKPSNIFITDTGLVKILDFGIARLREEAPGTAVDLSEATTQTAAGRSRLVGTAGYMSPEQIEGRPLDGRSDIFGLGCVMYEILTARRAFQGATPVETMLAILHEDPVSISVLRPEVPHAVELVVRRCMEKQAGERFESARDVAFALAALAADPGSSPPGLRRRVSLRSKRRSRMVAGVVLTAVTAAVLGAMAARWTSTQAAILPATPHLAVMRFAATGDDPELQRFAAGLGEILADALEWRSRSTTDGSWVVPGDAIAGDDAEDTDLVLRRFNPNVMLTGTVDRRGSRLRLRLASVDPATGEVFSRADIAADLGNVSSLQIEPVERAAELVGLELTADHREELARRSTNVSKAFDLFARARGVLRLGQDEQAAGVAIDLLDQSVTMDPLFEPARLALAGALAAGFSTTGDHRLFDRSLAELQRLRSSGPSAESWRIEARLRAAAGDDAASVAALRRAVDIDPHFGMAFLELGAAELTIGHRDEVERAYQRAANLDPGYRAAPEAMCRLYLSEGRFDAAANAARQVIACAPRYRVGYNLLGVVQFLQDQAEAARATFEQSIAVDPEDNYPAYSNLGTIHFNAARFADAIVAFEKALEITDTNYQVWGNLAYAYALGPEPEKARRPFERAIELAEARSSADPTDVKAVVDLAAFKVMIGDAEASSALLERAVGLAPGDPQLQALIGETYEDLDDRKRALQWISRAIDGGIDPGYFASRPMLRDLIADPQYRRLVADGASPG